MPPKQVQYAITGLPGSGKSTLARLLGREFGLPVFMKDHFKEAMYEVALPDGDYQEMGSDPQALLGKLSFRCISVAFEAMAAAAIPAVFEANFDSQVFSKPLDGLCKTYQVHLLQIHLICERNVLVERFERRGRAGQRHPGHQGDRHAERVRRDLMQRPDHPLKVESGQIFEVDTTTFSDQLFADLISDLRHHSG